MDKYYNIQQHSNYVFFYLLE